MRFSEWIIGESIQEKRDRDDPVFQQMLSGFREDFLRALWAATRDWWMVGGLGCGLGLGCSKITGAGIGFRGGAVECLEQLRNRTSNNK